MRKFIGCMLILLLFLTASCAKNSDPNDSYPAAEAEEPAELTESAASENEGADIVDEGSRRRQPGPAAEYYNTTVDLNLRNGPGTDFAIIMTVGQGATVKVLSFLDGEWFMVEFEGRKGYMKAEYLAEAADMPAPYVDENYKFNSAFTFSGLLFDQKSGDAAKLKMGYYTGDYNGCGWVATYNTGVMLGHHLSPADIIKYFDSHGGALVDGAFGVNPLAITLYLNEQGIEASILNLPTETDARIKNSEISILLYFHDQGGHYTTIQYADEMYYAYNNSQAWTTAAQPLPSVDAWLKENKYWAVSIITISKAKE